MRKQLICNCFYHRAIFLREYRLHVHFVNEQQFETDYRQVLRSKGCKGDISHVVKQVKDELRRRQEHGQRSSERKQYIRENYQPLHKDVYQLQESFLHPDFLRIMKTMNNTEVSSKSSLLEMITTCKASRVYSFPVFSSIFCEKLMEELKHFEESGMPMGRPNTMNTSGLLLEELGFYSQLFNVLRERYLNPLASVLYPDWIGDSGLDSQRAFIVRYNHEKSGEDTELSCHYDNAEVTLNVSLTDKFEGGELYFGGMRQESCSENYTRVDHCKSRGVFHRGQHFHGAMPIEGGERYNLIVWMRSSSIRNKQCPMCDERPVLVETPGDGDGFTVNDVNVCSVV